MTRLAILGSTGSIGTSALDVVNAFPDRLQVVSLAAGRNTALLAEQVRRFRPRLVAVEQDEARARLGEALGSLQDFTVVTGGAAGLIEAATHPDVEVVLCATSGTAGLEAVLAAIDAGKTIALANKEVLVMAGAVMMDAARRRGVAILPVDSEHNAIHQCLDGRRVSDVSRLILTASGGPFRRLDAAALERVTPADALRHPTWQMGRKITIDSATLMNKGLEVIEAHWLFELDADRIGVVIHPQSVVHSMVEFRDGSILAQLGVTDMRLPIQYAFSYPERWTAPIAGLNVARLGRLDFEPPDLERFPCLALAYEALRAGGAAPVVLNAANEVAVAAFLEGRVPFSGIPATVAAVLERHGGGPAPADLAAIREVDGWARAVSAETVNGLPSS